MFFNISRASSFLGEEGDLFSLLAIDDLLKNNFLAYVFLSCVLRNRVALHIESVRHHQNLVCTSKHNPRLAFSRWWKSFLLGRKKV